MTLRPLPRAHLERLVPSLVHGQALVALVPVTGQLRWAAEVAWEVARAAARDGRRVALVDLWVEEPVLHEIAGVEPSDGIVDAFEFGVSLNKTAHEVNGVFFIAAGSYPASVGDVLANARWRRLQAGFRSQDALLLLYLSPDALTRLSAVPDGVIVLAPQGVEAECAASESGAAMLGVVQSSPPVFTRSPLSATRRGGQGVRTERARGGQGVLVPALVTAVVLAGGWALFARSAERVAIEPVPAAEPTARATARRDTLAWTVQLAAYGTLESALDHADALLARDVPALVAPIVHSGSSPVWYRVLAGQYPSRDSAAAARTALWDHGAAPRGRGDLLLAPYSLALVGIPADSLRRVGVPVMRWPDGRLLVGAFETPDQATFAAGLVARAGARATLVTRTGRATTP